jgi:hypothetical protein
MRREQEFTVHHSALAHELMGDFTLERLTNIQGSGARLISPGRLVLRRETEAICGTAAV